jgi:acyl-CoA synthetase (NDP forming)
MDHIGRASVDLDALFAPERVVVIGASDAEGRPTTLNWRRVAAWATRVGAEPVPVHPHRDVIDGVPAYRSIEEVPGDIDVAIVLIGNVDSVLPGIAAKGVRFVVLFAAGYAETGPDGERRQGELVRSLRAAGVRALGPNTNMNLFEEFRTDLPGRPIALITQSGHQGRPVFQGQELGIRFSHWAPTGNEADLNSADFVDYFAHEEDTGAIALYLEGFADGTAFRRAARVAARRGVPMVAVKVGRTEIGRSWAMSHTGHLAGADDVASAVLRQYGIARVDGLDELLDTAALFARAGDPPHAGICVYSISGGTSAHMADLLGSAGLDLPELSAETVEQLRQWIPDYLRVSNPVDNGGHPVGDWRGRRILETILADPAVGILVVPITGAFPPMSDNLVADLVAVAETTSKPICVVWGSPAGTEDAYRRVLLGSRLPVFRTFGNCVTAIQALADHLAFRERVDELPAIPDPPPALAGPGRQLTELDAKRLLAEHGVPVSRDALCAGADEVARVVDGQDGPVVLKAVVVGLAHKSEHGLVRLGIADATQARAVVADFERIVADLPGSELAGVLVSEQVHGGVEMVVGIAPDPVFGPTVMLGLGGVAVELYRDVTFRVPPFERAEVHRMIGELIGSALLKGFRGAPPADLEPLVDVVMAVQRLAADGVVSELDINPLIVLPDRVVAVDALASVPDQHETTGAVA